MEENASKTPKHYCIAGVTDLAVSLTPEEAGFDDAPEAVFHVEKSRLVTIEYFRVLLRGRFHESSQQTITLVGDNTHALRVWMRILHSTDLDVTYSETTTPLLWEVVAIAKKYGFEPKDARAWLTEWLQRNYHDLLTLDLKEEGEMPPFGSLREQIVDQAGMLLLPCHLFDRGKAFLQVTRILAYNVAGHISELRPSLGRRDLHVLQNIIQQLNAAKGRLRIILHKALYKPIKKQLAANCNHKDKMLFKYEHKLYKTHAWPLEETGHRTCIIRLLSMIATVDSMGMPTGCPQCQFNVQTVIKAAKAEVEQYFDGLCPGCMHESKRRDDDDDYWHHYDIKEWCQNCRVTHGEPSWYFPFMGRRHRLTAWTQKATGALFWSPWYK